MTEPCNCEQARAAEARADAAERSRDALNSRLNEIAAGLGRYHEWDYGWQRADHATIMRRIAELTGEDE